MSDTIDLESPPPDDEETPSQRRRRERRERGGDSSGGRKSRSSAGASTDDAGLAAKLDTAFNKLADQMDVREDEELASALREESRAMSQGFVSVTRTIPLLRSLLLVVLAFAEVGLAFWRVGRILLYRFLAWRQRRIDLAEQAQAQAEWEAASQPGVPA